jgi:hypothetical protein
MRASESLEAGIARASEAADKLPHILRLAREGTFDLPLLLGVRHLAREYSSGIASREAEEYAIELENAASELYKEIKGPASRENIALLGRRAARVFDQMRYLLARGRGDAKLQKN